MKYSVDRIEDDLIVLEDIETGEKKTINQMELPEDIKEGNIINEVNEELEIDVELEEERRKNIRDRFNKLKKK